MSQLFPRGSERARARQQGVRRRPVSVLGPALCRQGGAGPPEATTPLPCSHWDVAVLEATAG